MARLTILFGVLLAVLGAGFFFASVPHAPTSLIPLYFGIALMLLGALAMTDDSKRRMLFMHIAVTIGLLGFLFPFFRAVPGAIKMLQGVAVAHPLAIEEQMLMALLCLIFVGLCVRSFIAARRARI